MKRIKLKNRLEYATDLEWMECRISYYTQNKIYSRTEQQYNIWEGYEKECERKFMELKGSGLINLPDRDEKQKAWDARQAAKGTQPEPSRIITP